MTSNDFSISGKKFKKKKRGAAIFRNIILFVRPVEKKKILFMNVGHGGALWVRNFQLYFDWSGEKGFCFERERERMGRKE